MSKVIFENNKQNPKTVPVENWISVPLPDI